MSTEEKLVEVLAYKIGEENARKLIKLQQNMDKYMLRFKKEVNEILAPYGHEVLCGIAYKEK